MSQDTRQKILDVAESLFAERGFAATSLRDITTEAGVNLAAVNYHFGSKEALLASVMERRIAPVNQERLKMLDVLEAEAGEGAVPVEALLRALLAPPFHQHRAWDDQGTTFLQLLGRLYTVPHEQVRGVMKDQMAEVMQRFIPAFRRALSHLDEAEVGWRLFFVIGTLINTLMWSRLINTFGAQPHDSEELLDALVAFASAGMEAAARTRAVQHVG